MVLWENIFLNYHRLFANFVQSLFASGGWACYGDGRRAKAVVRRRGGAAVKILGIDPGTQVLGYGVVEKTPRGIVYVTHGHLKIAEKVGFTERLGIMSRRVAELISEIKPQVAVIEKIFLGKNVDSAFKLGHIRGVCIYESQKWGAEICEYTPRVVKQGIAGSGAASKEQVQTMLYSLLNIRGVKESLDASDALALAFYHAGQMDLQRRFRRAGIDI
jgi:crossover junction endodeoxyribonuclease RuvC